MSESIESIMAMLQAMSKEQKAQNELVMQRISGIEEQLRDSASKDDVREMQEQMNAQVRGVNARIDTVNKTLLKLDWRALRWRRLDWALLPHTTRKGALSFLSLEDSMGLNHAMTNNEARPHLIESYRDMRSPAFDQHVYTDKEDYRALRWAMEKGINLQGFRMERKGEKRSGVILARLMGWWTDTQEQDRKLDIAKYYVTRGKMQGHLLQQVARV